jgi:glycosyltransferase involved in cell wall biosynthesis
MVLINTHPVFCVAPVLPQDVRHQCQALDEAGLLNRVICSLAYSEGGPVESSLRWLDRAIGTQIVMATERRRFGAVPHKKVSSQPWPEFWTQVGRRVGLVDRGPRTTDRYLARVDLAASRQLVSGVRLVIAREDCCRKTFATARRIGARCLYDLPTTYYAKVRAIMEREAAEFPGASAENTWADEYSDARNARKDAELAVADHIIVPSLWARSSLIDAGISTDRVSAIPFGCQPRGDASPRRSSTAEKKVFLFTGNLSVRKGIPRLLRAWKRLGAFRTHTLRLIGSMYLTPKFLADYSGTFEYMPRLPRSELAQHYATSYAFIMPGAAEGMAVVITEAVSSGLPVIASENSGAAGFITHEKEGLLYAFADEDELCTALERMLMRSDEVADMGNAAYELSLSWTWREYRETYVALIRALLEKQNGTP